MQGHSTPLPVAASTGDAGATSAPSDVEVSQAAPAALGTIAKFAATPPKPFPRAALKLLQQEGIDARTRRFMLQAGARSLLSNERVAICLRRPIPGAALVDVMHSPAQRSAHYGNLIVCANTWACPVCAAKASERRREELSVAIAAWMGQVIMVTLTLQHMASDAIRMLLDDLREAKRLLCSGRAYQRLKSRYGVVGTVVALECTYGFVNGFHPHLHILFFVAGAADVEAFDADMRLMWPAAVEKVGRYASPKWGIDVTASTAKIAEYLAKWGKLPKWTTAHEMAKANMKRGRGESYSMWDLLENYTVFDDREAGALFVEYVQAFRGRSQLRYSPGLRALLGLVEEQKTDEELVEESVEDAVVLASLDLASWRVILANDARAELLNVASSGDVVQLYDFLSKLGIEMPDADQFIE